MATHSSILSWKIPWTGEPGGLQSMELKESDMTEHTHHHIITPHPSHPNMKRRLFPIF